MNNARPTIIALFLAFVFIAIVIFGSAKLTPAAAPSATADGVTPSTHRDTSSIPDTTIIDN